MSQLTSHVGVNNAHLLKIGIYMKMLNANLLGKMIRRVIRVERLNKKILPYYNWIKSSIDRVRDRELVKINRLLNQKVREYVHRVVAKRIKFLKQE